MDDLEEAARRVAREFLDPMRQEEAVAALLPVMRAMRALSLADPVFYQTLKDEVTKRMRESMN